MSSIKGFELLLTTLFMKKQSDELKQITNLELHEQVKKNHYDELNKFEEYLENLKYYIRSETVINENKKKNNNEIIGWDNDLTK